VLAPDHETAIQELMKKTGWGRTWDEVRLERIEQGVWCHVF
jgi:hypothetical protein